MAAATLGASLLKNMLTSNEVTRVIPPHPLTNCEIQKYYQNESKLNGFCSRNNFPKTKDETYVINLYECKSIGTHWIPFDSFRVEYIPK